MNYIRYKIQRTFDAVREWRFAFYLGAGMIAFQLAILGLDLLLQPPEARWLGAHAVNASDAAVYLNYLAQGKSGLGLSNLYFNLPQTPRFDPFWSTAGLLVSMGMRPIDAHLALRLICTLALAFALYAAAKSTTRHERDARWASVLMVLGMSAGFLNAILFSLYEPLDPRHLISPDLDTEFAIAPMLLGGAHIILSVALQMVAIRLIWTGVREPRNKPLAWGSLASFLLTSFHPYFIPLMGLVATFAWAWPGRDLGLRQRTSRAILAALPMTIPCAYYVWMLSDASFKSWSQANVLPLQPAFFWAVALLPIIIAGLWLWRKRNNYPWRELHFPHWAVAWLAAATVCVILPFPWARKYTQALLPALVLLTLPAWLKARDWARNQTRLLQGLLAMACGFTFIFLAKQELNLLTNIKWNGNFYQTDAMFKAWDLIRSEQNDGLVLSTDRAVNIWTPAYTLHTVWIGHPHATPDFNSRAAAYDNWRASENPMDYNRFLDAQNIKFIVTYPTDQTVRAQKLLDDNWRELLNEQGVGLWRKLDVASTE